MKYAMIIKEGVLIVLLSAYTPLGLMRQSIQTVVIDAGHGGHDVGCMYGGAREKEVTLDIALRVGKLMKSELPDVKVIYTRNDDRFIELWERAGIANRNNADLFVSIHCNANKKLEVFGTETFAMGLHKTEGNLDVAKRENDVILLEKDYQEKYEGFDPNSPEAHIYFSFMQSAYLEQSLTVAALVEEQFKKINRNSRGVKQAGLMVLWRSKMPSVLIETGFLSNKSERGFLTSEEGQEAISQSIVSAISGYKSKLEGSK